jgi:hypothetical protein
MQFESMGYFLQIADSFIETIAGILKALISSLKRLLIF